MINQGDIFEGGATKCKLDRPTRTREEESEFVAKGLKDYEQLLMLASQFKMIIGELA